MKLQSINLTCLLISTTLVSGCVHGDGLASVKDLSRAITDEAIYISQARKNATNGIIFSNILEARDRGLGDHNVVTGVLSNPTSSSEITATLDPLGLGNPGAELEASTGGVTRGAGKSGSFSVNPAGTGLDEGGTPLQQPVPKSVFENYWNSGWPKDVLLSLMVRNYKVDEKLDCKNAKGENDYNDGKEASKILNCITEHFGSLENIVLKNLKKPIQPDEIFNAEENLKAAKKDLKKEVTDIGKRRAQKKIDNASKNLWIQKRRYNEAQKCKKLDRSKFTNLAKNLSRGGETTTSTIKTISKLYGGDIKIGLADELLICEKNSPSKKIKLYHETDHEKSAIEIELRSYDEMVYFIGEAMRNSSDYLYSKSSNYDEAYDKTSKVPLLKTTKIGSKNDYAVWTQHRGNQVYTVKRINLPSKDAEDRSQTTFVILRHVLELNQSKAFLKAPDNQFVIR